MPEAMHPMRDECKVRFRNIDEDIKLMAVIQREHEGKLANHNERLGKIEDHEDTMLKAQNRNSKLLVLTLLGILALAGGLFANVAIHLLK